MSTLPYTLFPYTTLFRAPQCGIEAVRRRVAAILGLRRRFPDLVAHVAHRAVVDGAVDERIGLGVPVGDTFHLVGGRDQGVMENGVISSGHGAPEIDQIGRASCRERVCKYV